MSAENNVPSIRFKGVSGEWDEKCLGDIGSLKNGMNFDKTAMGHGHPFVNLQDVFGKNEVSNNNLGLAFSTVNQRKEYSLNEGDVLFIRSSVKPEGVGEAAVISKRLENTTYSGFIIRFRPNIDMDVNFNRFVYSTANSRRQILASSTSSANSNINQDSLQRIQLALPCKEEQTKIGNYFQQLDTLIAQHQQKHDKLLNLKAALLEKTFPKQGATVPEIRFKGFSGEWAQRAVVELCSISTGKNNTQDKIHDGEYPFYVRSATVERSNNYLFDEEAVLTVGDGVGTGKVYHYVRGKYDLHQRVYRMYDFNGVTGKYFYYYFSNNFYDRVMSMTAKTSVDSVRLVMISNMSIKLPVIEEQKNIAKLLSSLDTLLTQHQAQLKKLNNIKQACLEKMFV